MVDANVVVKWTVPETLFEQARSLLETEHELLAPDIILVEAANALLKKVRLRELSEAGAREAIDALPRYLHVSPTADVYQQGLELSFAVGCTFFDALYVAFALEQDCRFVTGDGRLVRSLPQSLAEHVVHLGDLA